MNNYKDCEYERLTLRLAQKSDREALEDLRRNAYHRSNGLKLIDDAPLRWQKSDEIHITLVIENDQNKLVASNRLIKIDEPKDFLQKTNLYAPDHLKFPTLYSKTAVTASSYGGAGLNIMFKIAIFGLPQITEIGSWTFTVSESKSLIERYSRLGCRFEKPHFQPRDHTNSPFVFLNTIRLGILDQTGFSAFAKGNPHLMDGFRRLNLQPESLTRISEYLVHPSGQFGLLNPSLQNHSVS